MTYKKMVLTVLLLIISAAISRTDGPRAWVAQWQNKIETQVVAAAICRDEPVLEAVGGHVPSVHVNTRETWSASKVRQCAMAGDIESKLDVFFSNATVVMVGSIFESVTGLRLDSALRTLLVGAFRLASALVSIEILGNPGTSVLL
jgi:hypothetical protein